MSDTQTNGAEKNNKTDSTVITSFTNYSLGYNSYSSLPSYTNLDSHLEGITGYTKSTSNANEIPDYTKMNNNDVLSNNNELSSRSNYGKNRKGSVQPNIKTSNTDEAYIENNGDIMSTYVKNDNNTGSSINYSQVSTNSNNQRDYDQKNNRTNNQSQNNNIGISKNNIGYNKINSGSTNQSIFNNRNNKKFNNTVNNSGSLGNSYKGPRQNSSKNRGKSCGCFLFILIFIFVIIIIGFANRNSNKTSGSYNSNSNTNVSNTSKTGISNSAKTSNSRTYTFDNFEKVKMGISYDDVVKILGKETKKKQTDSTVSDRNGISCTWVNKDYSSIVIFFDNSKVTSKYAVGFFNNVYSNISKVKYDKLKKGMTYDQVKKILGEGILENENKFSSKSADVKSYKWKSKDDEFIDLDFHNGKLYSIYQENLK